MKKHLFITLSTLYATISITVSKFDFILSKIYPEKVWIHRVNSIEKLQEVAKNNFNSVELDVVFSKELNTFDVNHPPAKSINLSLNTYLKSITLTNKNHFWIDFKNLTKENQLQSLLQLASICTLHKLNKNQFIIESTDPSLLKLFSLEGFITSYYLPPELNKIPKEKINGITQNITHKIKEYNPNYISSDIRDYEIMTTFFSQKKMLVWSYNYSKSITLNPVHLIREIVTFRRKVKIIANPNTEIVLFKYSSKKGDR